MAAISKKARELLESIAAHGEAGTYAEQTKELAALVKNGLVEVSEEAEDADGNIAARVTDKGAAAVAPVEEPAAVPASSDIDPPTDGDFKIVSGVPAPKRRASGGRRGALYPFADLDPGQSFFVVATEAMPEPGRSLGGTVSQANARYATETGETRINRRGREVPVLEYRRKFFVRSIDDGEPWGFPGQAGAAVFREF